MRQRVTLSGTSADLKSRRSREDLINCFLEIDSSGSFMRITRAPCFRLLSAVGAGPIRDIYVAGSIVYLVSGSEFYRCTIGITGALSSVLKGSVTNSNGICSIESIGTDFPQIQIICGGIGYIYDEATSVFSQITDVDFTPDQYSTSFNSRFWLNKPNSNEFFGSDILDGMAYDSLFFASADSFPDALKRCKALNTEILMFSTASIRDGKILAYLLDSH